MKARIIILIIVLAPVLASAQKSDTVMAPIKKDFFPLEVGNKYIYEIRAGFKKRKIIGYDTVIVINKSIEEGYNVFKLNNGVVYYVKNDSVFSINFLESQDHNYNLLYFPTKNERHEVWMGSCSIKWVETTYLPTYKVGNRTYTNCYKFSEQKVIIIASGIGIIQTLYNGESSELIYTELK